MRRAAGMPTAEPLGQKPRPPTMRGFRGVWAASSACWRGRLAVFDLLRHVFDIAQMYLCTIYRDCIGRAATRFGVLLFFAPERRFDPMDHAHLLVFAAAYLPSSSCRARASRHLHRARSGPRTARRAGLHRRVRGRRARCGSPSQPPGWRCRRQRSPRSSSRSDTQARPICFTWPGSSGPLRFGRWMRRRLHRRSGGFSLSVSQSILVIRR